MNRPVRRIVFWSPRALGILFVMFLSLFALDVLSFLALPLSYLMISRGESWIISGPLFLVGLIFLLNWLLRKDIRPEKIRSA